MVVNYTSLILSLFLITSPMLGQSKPKKPLRPKPITATVVVKGGIKPLPKESDESLWTEFESKQDGVTLLFPGRKEDVLDDLVGPVKTIDASTAKAHYILAIRTVGETIDNREVDGYLEDTIESAFAKGNAKFLVKRDIDYNGRMGKHIVLEESGKRFAARLYFLNGKLFIIAVSMKSVDYSPEFEKWIDKFFNSLKVDLPVIEA